MILEDDETYTIAHDKPAKEGDQVLSWFDDHWQKPVAKYPKADGA